MFVLLLLVVALVEMAKAGYNGMMGGSSMGGRANVWVGECCRSVAWVSECEGRWWCGSVGQYGWVGKRVCECKHSVGVVVWNNGVDGHESCLQFKLVLRLLQSL